VIQLELFAKNVAKNPEIELDDIRLFVNATTSNGSSEKIDGVVVRVDGHFFELDDVPPGNSIQKSVRDGDGGYYRFAPPIFGPDVNWGVSREGTGLDCKLNAPVEIGPPYQPVEAADGSIIYPLAEMLAWCE
jgi:hypothetical protein